MIAWTYGLLLMFFIFIAFWGWMRLLARQFASYPLIAPFDRLSQFIQRTIDTRFPLTSDTAVPIKRPLINWAFAGMKFDALRHWIVVGGLRYTAYTYIAVPALIFRIGAEGYYVVPYTIIANLLMFIIMPRFWEACHDGEQVHLTTADLVKERLGGNMAFLIAITSLFATVTYLAVQIYAIDLLLSMMGIEPEVPLVLLLLIFSLALYKQGMRVIFPTALMKDVLTTLIVFVAFVFIAFHAGGWDHIFALTTPHATTALPPAKSWGFITLALGSAFGLWLYPHTQISIMTARSRDVVKRSAVFMPLYTIPFIIFTLLGLAAVAYQIHTPSPFNANAAVPQLFLKIFHNWDWFIGLSFAVLTLGALVSAMGMSVASGLVFARNILPYVQRREVYSAEDEMNAARLASLFTKVGSLAIVLYAVNSKLQDSIIDFELLGGVCILQTLPAFFAVVYKVKLQRIALFVGWLAGMSVGIATWILSATTHKSSIVGNLLVQKTPFGAAELYSGILGVGANLACCLVFFWLSHSRVSPHGILARYRRVSARQHAIIPTANTAIRTRYGQRSRVRPPRHIGY